MADNIWVFCFLRQVVLISTVHISLCQRFLWPHLAQGQHHEGPSATGVHNHGHKFGVNRAEVAVPCHLGDSDVIVALVSFHGLTKDVTELAGPHHLPEHGELEPKQRKRTECHVCIMLKSRLFNACKADYFKRSYLVLNFRYETAERHDGGKKKKKRKQKLSQLLPLSVAANLLSSRALIFVSVCLQLQSATMVCAREHLQQCGDDVLRKKKGAVHRQSSCSPKKVNEFPKAAVTPHPSDVSTKATDLSLSSQTHALCDFFSFFKHTTASKNQDTYSAPTIKNTEYALLYLHLKI